MSNEPKLILVGAGGAGIEALMVARRMAAWSLLGFADDAARERAPDIDGIPVLGVISDVAARFAGQRIYLHFSIGSNRDRERLGRSIEGDFLSATLIDPSANIAPSAMIGAGSYVGPMAFVGPGAKIGRHVLVNVASSIGHHSVVEDFSQVCPGACISGNARLGMGAFVGSNGVVAPGVRMGEWSVLGAASLTARDVPPHYSAIGVPARMIGVPETSEQSKIL